MTRRTPLLPIERVLALAIFALLAGNGNGYAQQSAADEVKAAIDAYHAAISALDMAKMASLWVQDASVMLVNPRDKSISVGWNAVKKSWEAVPNVWSELRVTQAEGPNIRVQGNIAWSIGIASVVGKTKSGAAVNAPTLETDVFEKRGGRWLLVSHTASRVPQ
jgi:ketosteroid isomerase-like protein